MSNTISVDASILAEHSLYSKSTEAVEAPETSARERAKQVRENLERAVERMENSYIELAQLLKETWDKEYIRFWGYSTMKEYVENDLGISYRKARYLIGIAKTVEDLHLSWDQVRNIGWTKVRELVPYVDKSNVNEWLDRADNLSVRELKEEVNRSRATGELVEITPREEKIASLNLRLRDEEMSAIMDAVDEAKRELGTEETGIALHHICCDYLARSGGSIARLPLETIVDWIREVYGVALVPEPQDLSKIVQEEKIDGES